MRLDDLNAQLAARFLIQKADQIERVEATVSGAAEISARWFRQDILPIVSWAKGKDPAQIAQRVNVGLQKYWGRVEAYLERALTAQTTWAYEDGYQAFVDTLPRAYWLNLAAAKGIEVREGVDYSGAGSVVAARGLFQPMDRATVRGIVFAPPDQARDGLNWEQRIRDYSRLTTEPAAIADTISFGLRAGKNPRDVAKKVLPWVQNNATAANRLTRTEMLRVSQEGLRQQWGQFADVISGFKILSSLDERTRPHHRTRHGDLYANPGENGQMPEGAKGLPEDRPIVPDEPNCRCYESPVLKALPGVFQDVTTKDKTAASPEGIIEDPVTASRWFDQQDVGRKKRILGARRYGTISGNLERAGAGKTVTWADAVDTKDGKLILQRDLKGEPVQATLTRRAANERAFLRRETLLKADSPELFPGLRLIGRGGPPPPPPPPPVDPPPPPPPPAGGPPHGLTVKQAEAIDRWQAEGHTWTRDYYREEGFKNWAHVVTKREVNVGLVRKMDAGLKKLPVAVTAKGNAKTVYRGLQNVSERELNQLLQAQVVDWDNYQAASLSKKVGASYANGGPGTNNVLLRMKSANGRDLRGLGGRAAQDQTVLFERGRRWKVGKVTTKTTPNGGKLYEVLLEETVPTRDSPLISKVTSPRKRLWTDTPDILPPPTPPRATAKPAFSSDYAVAIDHAKRELAELGLTKDALQSGFVADAQAHTVFWEKLREVNGTASTATGVRAGVMTQRKKILASFDRKIKRLEKDLAEWTDRAIAAHGADQAAWPRWVKQARNRVAGSVRTTTSKRALQAKWFQDFAEVADESLVQNRHLGTVQWKMRGHRRAAAYKWSNEIKVSAVDVEGAETFAHEFGHHVEYRNQRVQDRLVKWRRDRGQGLPMKSVYPHSPRSSEVGWPDPWYNGYAGRVYHGRKSTEILSMGLQSTTSWSELAEVARADYDHVAMTWAILRGY